MNGVRVSPAPVGCSCPPQSGFGASQLHFATYKGCALNTPKRCDHEYAHRLMKRCGFCGWVDPSLVLVPVEQLQRLMQHVQLSRECCREAAQPVRDLIDQAIAS